MDTNKKRNIQGSWLGTYYYNNINRPNSFEAVFLEQNGQVDGNILDGGSLGEARVTGSFQYPKVSFVKKYDTPGLDPVRYEGMMDEDGNRMSGSWTIDRSCRGTWIAWRHDNEGAQEEYSDEAEESQLETVVAAARQR